MIRKFKSGLNITSISAYLPLLFMSLIGLFVYNKFIKKDVQDIKDDENDKASFQNKTTPEAVQGNKLTNQKTDLEKKGFVVGLQHQSIANDLHGIIDSINVDEELLIKKINSINNNQTWLLVNVAYGQRDIPNYRNNPLHLNVWKDLFRFKNAYGDLRTHLIMVLNEKELQQIQPRLNKI